MKRIIHPLPGALKCLIKAALAPDVEVITSNGDGRIAMGMQLGEFIAACAQERFTGAMHPVNDLHLNPPGMGALFVHFYNRT